MAMIWSLATFQGCSTVPTRIKPGYLQGLDCIASQLYQENEITISKVQLRVHKPTKPTIGGVVSGGLKSLGQQDCVWALILTFSSNP